MVATVQSVFVPRWTALVLPDPDAVELGAATTLQVAATAGQSLTEADVTSLTSGGGQARSLGLLDDASPRRVSVALVVNHRPVGMLVLQDVQLVEHERSLLGTFANQAALAVDRAQLSEQALRARLLEEIDRWRRALMGAASHDLRTPLASIKTAVSSMRQVDAQLSSQDRAELLELIELQSDRLARLVTNLLDMTRLEAGALELRPTTVSFRDLVDEALALLGGIVTPGRVTVEAPSDLPLLHLDHVLMSQVLANVLENAERISPASSRHPRRSATSSRTGGAGRDRRGRRRSRHRSGITVRASSRCSARTAAVAGPGSAWPSPRPSSRRTVGSSGSTPTWRTAPASSSPSRRRPASRRRSEAMP